MKTKTILLIASAISFYITYALYWHLNMEGKPISPTGGRTQSQLDILMEDFGKNPEQTAFYQRELQYNYSHGSGWVRANILNANLK